MSDTDQIKEDDVLRRMLNTPHKPHKPKGARATKKRIEETSSSYDASGAPDESSLGLLQLA